MANIHFYLRTIKVNKKGQHPIVMRVTHNYARPIFFTGYSVNPKYWSKKNEKVLKERDGEPENNYDQINSRLNIFRQKAEDAIDHALKNNMQITDAYLRNEITSISGKRKPTRNLTFFEVITDYIETSKAVRANRTIIAYGTIKKFLEDFEEKTGFKIDINSIDYRFFDRLRTYAFKERKEKVKDNYFAKIISVLKAMLTWAYKRGYIKDQTYREFKAVEREVDVVFLTLDELMDLYNHDFKSVSQSRARDLFCFMCFTGLRVSDVRGLKRDNIRNGQIIKTIVKTRKTEIIPLNQWARNILEKYKDNELYPLPKMADQKLNVQIKKCCEEIKMKEKITIVEYFGGRAKEVSKFKYELITNHTARKTFITNSIMMGMNTKTIKDITGHKKDSVFNKYVKISEDFKKLEMERTWDSIPTNSVVKKSNDE